MQRRGLALVGLVALVALAGCGVAVPDVVASDVPGLERTHPFAERTVTVAVDGTDRERRLTAAGFRHWEDDAPTYAGFNVSFTVVDAAEDPDVRVTYVDRVTACGEGEHAAGCAPRLNATTRFDPPAAVQIKRGLADSSTEQVVRHEAGHLLGLTHRDDPQSVMAADQVLATQPQPDATERVLPWGRPNLTVAVVTDGVADDEVAAFEAQVDYGLAYYREGADGSVPDNLTITRGSDPEAADIVIRRAREGECPGGAASCWSVQGTDPDSDGAIETYTRATILLGSVDTDGVSWHVARQFANAVGLTEDELPDPLAIDSYRERRSEWHG